MLPFRASPLVSLICVSALLLFSSLLVCVLSHSVPITALEKYRGRLLGSGANQGQCATGVQVIFEAAKQPLGLTKTWRRGERVVDTAGMRSGTAVATFKDANTYDHHAAVYERQNATHVTVWDQYASPVKEFGPRDLPKGKGGSNGADDLYAIATTEAERDL